MIYLRGSERSQKFTGECFVFRPGSSSEPFTDLLKSESSGPPLLGESDLAGLRWG